MKTFEKILGILLVIALFFNYILWADGCGLSSIPLTLLACIYCFYGFAFFNNIKLKEIFRKKSY